MSDKATHPTPRPSARPKRPKEPEVVTVRVTIRNTPPDAARLEAQRRAIETILAVLARD
jgi:hypothetical protein